MRKFSRVAAALVLGTTLAAVASAQPPAGAVPPPATTPPASTVPPPAVPALTPPAGLVPPPASVAPPAPAPKVEPRPTGTAATVTTTLGAQPMVQPIPEVAVHRALRQFPDSAKEMARKEIINHLVENTLIDH